MMMYLVLSRQVPGKDEQRRQHLPAHMDWLHELHRSGVLLFSGPTTDRTIGIYLMAASSADEAIRLAASDPHHVHGERIAEVHEWEVMQTTHLSNEIMTQIDRLAVLAPPDAKSS